MIVVVVVWLELQRKNDEYLFKFHVQPAVEARSLRSFYVVWLNHTEKANEVYTARPKPSRGEGEG